MDRDGQVEILLRGAHADGDGGQLDHLARFGGEDVAAQHLAGAFADDQLGQRLQLRPGEQRPHGAERRGIDLDVAALGRFLFGQADARQFVRAGIDRARDQAVIDVARMVAEDRVGEGVPLADRDGGQVHAVGDVAHGKDRRHVRLRPLVHDDLAALAQRDARVLQPQRGGVGMAAGGQHHRVVAVGRAVAEGRAHAAAFAAAFAAVAVAVQPLQLHLQPEGDPGMFQLVRHHLAALVVEPAQHQIAAVGQRGVAAETVEDGREFAGDEAAAHDQHLAGQPVHHEQVVRDHRQIVARDARPGRAAAGGHKDVGGGLDRAVRQLDRMRVADARALVVDIDARRFQPALVDPFQPRQLLVQLRAERRPVEPPRLDLPAIGARFLDSVGRLGCEDHQLLGHAAPDDAGAAEPAFLGQRHAGAVLACRDPGRADAARSPADDEKVVVEAHAASSRVSSMTEP